MALRASYERWYCVESTPRNPFHTVGGNALPDPAHSRGRHMRSAPPFTGATSATDAFSESAPALAAAIAQNGSFVPPQAKGTGVRCVSGCGFFGTAAASGYCSQCWRVARRALGAPAAAANTTLSAAAASAKR
jgi:hypothetical protein